MTRFASFSVIIAAVTVTGAAQQVDPATCPLHAAHHTSGAKPGPRAHGAHADMEARGTKAMGFDQSRASHHFRLSPTGGSIEIHTNSADDATTRQQVVTHLEAIAKQFKEGDFSIPDQTHGRLPDGVAGLKRFKEEITYTFSPTSHGGRVVISTRHDEALSAVHEFLRYQIREHRTGDPMAVPR